MDNIIVKITIIMQAYTDEYLKTKEKRNNRTDFRINLMQYTNKMKYYDRNSTTYVELIVNNTTKNYKHT